MDIWTKLAVMTSFVLATVMVVLTVLVITSHHKQVIDDCSEKEGILLQSMVLK